MKKKNLVLALAMAATFLTACQSGVSQKEYQSLEARASQAESERDDLNALQGGAVKAEQQANESDFNKHETVSMKELPDFLKNDEKAQEEMVSVAGTAFFDSGISTDNLEFLGFENYHKLDGDKGKQNSGFQIDLIFNSKLRKVSCSLYYFDNTGEWTFIGIKDYEKPHWYYVNSGIGSNTQLYDYETDTLK